jgi:hypothetical protein
MAKAMLFFSWGDCFGAATPTKVGGFHVNCVWAGLKPGHYIGICVSRGLFEQCLSLRGVVSKMPANVPLLGRPGNFLLAIFVP